MKIMHQYEKNNVYTYKKKRIKTSTPQRDRFLRYELTQLRAKLPLSLEEIIESNWQLDGFKYLWMIIIPSDFSFKLFFHIFSKLAKERKINITTLLSIEFDSSKSNIFHILAMYGRPTAKRIEDFTNWIVNQSSQCNIPLSNYINAQTKENLNTPSHFILENDSLNKNEKKNILALFKLIGANFCIENSNSITVREVIYSSYFIEEANKSKRSAASFVSQYGTFFYSKINSYLAYKKNKDSVHMCLNCKRAASLLEEKNFYNTS